MKLQIKNLIISSIIILCSFPTLASVITQCNTCSSQSSYESVAKYLGVNQSSSSTVIFIANFEENTMKKFKVTSVISSEPGIPDMVRIYHKELSGKEISAFDNASSVRNDIIDSVEQIPYSIAPSAYSLAGASYMLNNVSDHFNSAADIRAKTSAYLSSLAVIAGTITNVPITIELNFNDGSKGIFQITPTIGAPLTIRIIELKDLDNNTIPLTPAGYQSGSFKFTKQGKDGVSKFIESAARFGVKIVTGGGNGNLTTSCSQKSSGDYICVLVKR